MVKAHYYDYEREKWEELATREYIEDIPRLSFSDILQVEFDANNHLLEEAIKMKEEQSVSIKKSPYNFMTINGVSGSSDNKLYLFTELGISGDAYILEIESDINFDIYIEYENNLEKKNNASSSIRRF